jgi:hypothetical protein
VQLASSGSIRSVGIEQGTFDQNGQALSITGTLVLNGGAYDVHGGTLTLSGDLMNVGGTFSDSTGSVLMTGNSQKLFGSNTFHNLTKISTLTGGFLVLESGKTQTINGTLRWQGASGNVLTIISASSAYTNLTSGGSQIVDHVAVMNNVASGQQIVCYTSAEGCVDNGENSNWLFEPVVTSSSSSSSSSLSSQPTQGGRRGTTIDNQNNTDEEERYNVLFS